MRDVLERLEKDIKFMSTENFKNSCRLKKTTHFTRKRKMPLTKLISTTLFRKGRSLKIELKEFFKKFKTQQISKPGYLKQRLKLNPLAFLDVARFHAKQFYESSKIIKRYKGHLVFACDGADLNVPSTIENNELFQNSARYKYLPRPQAGFSCLFDVLNRQICDCTVTFNKLNERQEFLLHIKKF